MFCLDLAPEGEASQSSTFDKFEPENFNASYEIDDKNTWPNCFSTEATKDPYWQVDLKRTAKIFEIEIVNRLDTPGVDHRLGNFPLLVGDSEASLAPCLENENMNGIAYKIFPCRVTGQYIGVKTFLRDTHMNFYEVKVFGFFFDGN